MAKIKVRSIDYEVRSTGMRKREEYWLMNEISFRIKEKSDDSTKKHNDY